MPDMSIVLAGLSWIVVAGCIVYGLICYVGDYNKLSRPIRHIDFILRLWWVDHLSQFPKKARYLATFRNKGTGKLLVARSVSEYLTYMKIPDIELMTYELAVVYMENIGEHHGMIIAEDFNGSFIHKEAYDLWNGEDIEAGHVRFYRWLHQNGYYPVDKGEYE